MRPTQKLVSRIRATDLACATRNDVQRTKSAEIAILEKSRKEAARALVQTQREIKTGSIAAATEDAVKALERGLTGRPSAGNPGSITVRVIGFSKDKNSPALPLPDVSVRLTLRKQQTTEKPKQQTTEEPKQQTTEEPKQQTTEKRKQREQQITEEQETDGLGLAQFLLPDIEGDFVYEVHALAPDGIKILARERGNASGNESPPPHLLEVAESQLLIPNFTKAEVWNSARREAEQRSNIFAIAVSSALENQEKLLKEEIERIDKFLRVRNNGVEKDEGSDTTVTSGAVPVQSAKKSVRPEAVTVSKTAERKQATPTAKKKAATRKGTKKQVKRQPKKKNGNEAQGNK